MGTSPRQWPRLCHFLATGVVGAKLDKAFGICRQICISKGRIPEYWNQRLNTGCPVCARVYQPGYSMLRIFCHLRIWEYRMPQTLPLRVKADMTQTYWILSKNNPIVSVYYEKLFHGDI